MEQVFDSFITFHLFSLFPFRLTALSIPRHVGGTISYWHGHMGSTACEPTGSKTLRGRLHFMILRPHPEQSGRQVKFSKYVNEGVLIVCCLLSDPTP